MIILLFGNIGSGKTTIATSLLQLNLINYFAIDDYRRKYGNGSEKREEEVKDIFVNSIELKHTIILIETLGTGKLNDMLFDKLKYTNHNILIVVLKVSERTCLERIKYRNWDIPFPADAKKAEETIRRTHGKLYKQKSYSRWALLKNCSICEFDNNDNEDFTLIQEFLKKYINDNIY